MYQEQKKNEKAKHRIVGLTLETRPDYITFQQALKMREYGCTRVEIGVQHLDDKILKLNNRGHGVKKSQSDPFGTIKATKILRSLGFKITYHMMLNLPGSNPKKDYDMFVKLFKDKNFQPDQIKIYPCVVTKNSKLYKIWKAGKHKPYSNAKLRKLLEKIKSIIPYYVRIIRVIRDIPKESIQAGNKITNLRHLLDVKCKCIRCREIGHQPVETHSYASLQKPKLFIQKYKAGDGIEYFLSYESADRKILYAFCRLRVPSASHLLAEASSPRDKTNWPLITPMIRELHTYGQQVPISDNIKSASQHKGLGKKLIQQAEKIARQNDFKNIAVISGIGVREYYKKLGYKIKDTYLIKNI